MKQTSKTKAIAEVPGDVFLKVIGDEKHPEFTEELWNYWNSIRKCLKEKKKNPYLRGESIPLITINSIKMYSKRQRIVLAKDVFKEAAIVQMGGIMFSPFIFEINPNNEKKHIQVVAKTFFYKDGQLALDMSAVADTLSDQEKYAQNFFRKNPHLEGTILLDEELQRPILKVHLKNAKDPKEPQREELLENFFQIAQTLYWFRKGVPVIRKKLDDLYIAI